MKHYHSLFVALGLVVSISARAEESKSKSNSFQHVTPSIGYESTQDGLGNGTKSGTVGVRIRKFSEGSEYSNPSLYDVRALVLGGNGTGPTKDAKGAAGNIGAEIDAKLLFSFGRGAPLNGCRVSLGAGLDLSAHATFPVIGHSHTDPANELSAYANLGALAHCRPSSHTSILLTGGLRYGLGGKMSYGEQGGAGLNGRATAIVGDDIYLDVSAHHGFDFRYHDDNGVAQSSVRTRQARLDADLRLIGNFRVGGDLTVGQVLDGKVEPQMISGAADSNKPAQIMDVAYQTVGIHASGSF